MIAPPRNILRDFQLESNKIEGIDSTTDFEVDALEKFLNLPSVFTQDLVDYVAAVQFNASLRIQKGKDVRVGAHIPPPGGPDILIALDKLVVRANGDLEHPYIIHWEYEQLHPFTDGNGRSGRALWAWQMLRQCGVYCLSRGFLHTWYYQSLRHNLCKCEGTCGCSK